MLLRLLNGRCVPPTQIGLAGLEELVELWEAANDLKPRLDNGVNDRSNVSFCQPSLSFGLHVQRLPDLSPDVIEEAGNEGQCVRVLELPRKQVLILAENANEMRCVLLARVVQVVPKIAPEVLNCRDPTDLAAFRT